MSLFSTAARAHGVQGARASSAVLLVLITLIGAPRTELARASEDVERRVEALLAQMTLEEKIGQLNLMSHGPGFDIEAVRQGRVGALINFNNAPDIAPRNKPCARRAWAFPSSSVSTCCTGSGRPSRSRSPKRRRSTQASPASPANGPLARRPTSACNGPMPPWSTSSRDPRWGRIVEGSGEDPYVGRVFAAARIEGFRAGGLATAAKHFAGYGAVEGGRDYDATNIPQGELRDVYLPPFRAALEGRRHLADERLQRARRRAGDRERVAPDRCAAQGVGVRRLRGVGLGGDRGVDGARHRG